MQYISPDAQLPPMDIERTKEMNTPVSKRVICVWKGYPIFGYYYYELKCWRLDNDMQPNTVDLWAFLPPAIEKVNVLRNIPPQHYT